MRFGPEHCNGIASVFRSIINKLFLTCEMCRYARSYVSCDLLVICCIAEIRTDIASNVLRPNIRNTSHTAILDECFQRKFALSKRSSNSFFSLLRASNDVTKIIYSDAIAVIKTILIAPGRKFAKTRLLSRLSTCFAHAFCLFTFSLPA